MTKIAVPIDSELIGELFLRNGAKTDITSWVEDIVMGYLERTEDDGGWNQEYYAHLDEQREQEEFGDPKEGYHWQRLFLPNGTSLHMKYKGKSSKAYVKFGKIDSDGKQYSSPSQFAKSVAGEGRNAWRDIYIKRPKDMEPKLANLLRLQLNR